MPETTEKKNYKKTLNLPKTGFPMRAGLAQNEPASLKRWTEADLYASIMRQRADAPRFVFHDGPPYANGSIHAGHLLNKVLKDMVVRSQLLTGHLCPYVPGWDCHGLPIEHKVMTGLVESGKIEKLKTLDDDTRRMAIRKACRAYAEKYVAHQCRQMQRLLTLADYADPYLTMNARYERAVLEVFASMVEQGLVYRALKPVHWSIANQTALAEAELEYEDREDPSIYVDFEASDAEAVGRVFGVELDQTPSFMIWTTTPWTLPANLAIAVHERYRYALVKMDGSVSIVASDRVGPVAEVVGSACEVLAEVDGAALVGLRYRHPFCDRESPVVAADYVTLEDGTGLVHTAPGHGAEDYATGLKEGLEVYCPVRDDGTYDDTVPEWLRGMSVWDANTAVLEHVGESGHLVHHHAFVHSYPHDWRSKTPVIFRSTEQWFVAVDAPSKRDKKSLRAMALSAASDSIKFVPGWGKNRMRGMLESRPDWCLSRQRAWGLPIPAFMTPDGEMFLTAASVRAVAEAVGARGSDAWFTETPEALLATYDAGQDPDAPAGLDVKKLRKMYDIFDVWFESGSSWHAVMQQRGLGYPVDLYLEGSDQHRGWFQLSLLPGLAMTGESPFKTVLTHGFVLDKHGRKMSKSEGNAIDVDEIVKAHGADVCRWWISSLSVDNDIKADVMSQAERDAAAKGEKRLDHLDLAGESYRKVRNTVRFLLSNLSDFTPCVQGKTGGMCVDLKTLAPTSLDAYILDQTRRLQAEVLDAYRQYEFRKANQAIFEFCNETLSAFYCAAVKDRLYCDRPDSARRRATQTVMWDVVDTLAHLLAPLLPHTADETFRALWGDDTRCVHETTIGTLPEIAVDPDWTRVLEMRRAALKSLEDAKPRGIENPLDAEIVFPDPDGRLAKFADDLADMLGVSRVGFAKDGAITVNDLSDEPRCERSWRRDGTVKLRADGGWLSERDAEAVGV